MRALFALILLSLSCAGHAADDPKLAATRRLSQDQLEQAAATMSTPDGQSLQAASREAGILLSIAQYADQERLVSAAAQRYRESIQELVKRHEADPR